MSKYQQREFEEVEMEMTPMIDVTFLLLIFFIVTLKFKTLEGRLDASLPKDRGTSSSQASEVEKVDIVIKVSNPGQLVPDPATASPAYPEGRLKHYVGRKLRYEVGSSTFTNLEDLSRYLEPFARTQQMREETPVSIDPRKGTVYGDVVKVLDVVISKGFTQIAFGGSFEED
ncbi:MAG: biopolymer transporter ExbD [Planctomycetota bacterium]|nr:MAG: biopolymer transporter ExbD [Planctomycetota bacterium]